MTTLLCLGLAIGGPHASSQSIQDYFGTSVTVVNMIPYDRGGESNQDSEPNLAVNPENPMHIAGSAFTPNPMEDEQSMLLSHVRSSQQIRVLAAAPGVIDTDNGGNQDSPEGLLAPIYVSTDGGLTWQLNPIIESANARTGTNDITLRFSGRGGRLYAALLQGTSGFTSDRQCPVLDPSAEPGDQIFVKQHDCVPIYGPRMVIRRTTDFTSPKLMTGLKMAREFVDQPYIQATTVLGRDGNDEDRVFVANNDLNRSTNIFPGSQISDSRTATVDRSLKGNHDPSGLYQPFVIEPSSPIGQNGSGVRVAMHSSGTVYGIFYHLTNKSTSNATGSRYTTDVVVVRDDNWAQDSNQFSSLVDPQRNTIGVAVAPLRILPLRVTRIDEQGDICLGPLPDMGQERLVASDISIAVHPRNKDVVYVAWADSDRNDSASYNLHVRRSTDGGLTWSQDLITVAKSKNPALAVNRRGIVGFLYQAYDQDNRRWITHFRRTGTGESWSDIVLANVPADTPVCKFRPYIGDYVHLMAVDTDFYGIFSANNQPNPDNFPQGVNYQRYVHSDGTLRVSPFGEIVEPSIDPYFFKVTGLRYADEFLAIE
jgi:hypothetical protein